MNIDELKAKAETMLDKYEEFSGLPTFQAFDSQHIDKYFKMTIEQINKLSPEDCATAAFMLAQYSFYVQRLYNRESAQNRWASDQLTKLVCDKLGDYSDSYMKYDNKIALIAKENEVVAKLQSVINYTVQIMERLNYLATSIKNMGDIMANVGKAKSYSQKAQYYEQS